MSIRDVSFQALATGMLVAVVGFSSSVAIVMQGLRAVGASDAQAASALMALSVAMGLSAIGLSWRRRMPISVAWSTPGAALLIASGEVPGFAAAVGAFLLSSLLLLLAGIFRPMSRLIERIPASIANGMLAGILFGLCIAPIEALAFDARLAMPMMLVWLVVGQFRRYLAVPAALLTLLVMVWLFIDLPADLTAQLADAALPKPVWVVPELHWQTLLGIGMPLFIVTMASQNIPGIAVLRANGYAPPASPLITNTAIFSLLSAPFGGHAVNLAAITAAMCAGEDAHPDSSRRYWAAIFAGLFYIVLGLLAGVVVLLMTLVPVILIETLAGLALISAFAAACVAAFADAAEREAAVVTFLFAASGIGFFGIGGAFWGLLAGYAMLRSKTWFQRVSGSAR